MAAQICETCEYRECRCYCAPNSTCGKYKRRSMTRFEEVKTMSLEELAWMITEIKYAAVEKTASRCGFEYKVSENGKQKAFREVKEFLESKVTGND